MGLFRRSTGAPPPVRMPLGLNVLLVLSAAGGFAVVFGLLLWLGLGRPSLPTSEQWTVKDSFDFVKIVLAVVGGIGELLGLDRSLLVLALLPVLGALALVPTLRAERVRA